MTLLIFSACSTKTNVKSDIESSIARITQGIITDSLLETLPLVNEFQFEFKPESDDNVKENLHALTDKQVKFFYASKELIEYRESFGFTSYFYGKMSSRNELLPILILNTDNSTAIYLDCFLVNKVGKIVGMFNPTYLEITDYAAYCKGQFINDTTYNLTEISYQELESNPEMFVKDSSFTQIYINQSEGIIKHREAFPSDTITTQ